MDRYRGLLALVFVFLLCMIFSPRSRGALIFLSIDNQANVLRAISEIGILATGMTLVIITAGIDLSVGSVLGMCTTVFAFFLIRWNLSTVPSMLFTLSAGALAGFICGMLIAFPRVQPFVATLAMMVSARGVAKWISRGEKIQAELVSTKDGGLVREVPSAFEWIGARVFDDNIAVVSIVFIATLLLFHLVLAHTTFGRALYAIGGNEEAARLSGIRVKTVKVLAYTLCGLLAGLAGICHAAQDTYGNPDAGLMYELSAIAAVVIGGTSLMGGRGGMLLTLVGVLIIGYIENILRLNNVEYHIRLVIQGAIIVAAVLIQRRRSD